MPTSQSFTHSLPDGTLIEFRPIQPGDRERLQQGLALASSQTRYLRFFSVVGELTEQQLAYLTEVDQDEHVAWGALDLAHPEQPGVGVGRFIRLRPHAADAEVAVIVLDAYQHRGVGSLLFAILYLRARALGVQSLHAHVLPQNQFVADMLRAIGGQVEHLDGALHIRIPVADTTQAIRDQPGGHDFADLLDDVEQSLSEVL